MYTGNRSLGFELDGRINWDDTRYQLALGIDLIDHEKVGRGVSYESFSNLREAGMI